MTKNILKKAIFSFLIVGSTSSLLSMNQEEVMVGYLQKSLEHSEVQKKLLAITKAFLASKDVAEVAMMYAKYAADMNEALDKLNKNSVTLEQAEQTEVALSPILQIPEARLLKNKSLALSREIETFSKLINFNDEATLGRVLRLQKIINLRKQQDQRASELEAEAATIPYAKLIARISAPIEQKKEALAAAIIQRNFPEQHTSQGKQAAK